MFDIPVLKNMKLHVLILSNSFSENIDLLVCHWVVYSSLYNSHNKEYYIDDKNQ